MGFDQRKDLHDEIIDFLITEFFPRWGILAVEHGIENMPAIKLHPQLRHRYDDYTAKFIKHQPDIIIITSEKTYFIDVKTLNRYDTTNFSIEKDSYDILKDLIQLGTEIILIYNTKLEFPWNLKAGFFKDIKVTYWFDLNEAQGSGTPGGIFDKGQLKKDINAFFNDLKITQQTLF